MDGPFAISYAPTTDALRSGHYPLDRYLYLYARVVTGKRPDLLVVEHLKMVLSPEGQAAIADEW